MDAGPCFHLFFVVKDWFADEFFVTIEKIVVDLAKLEYRLL